MTGNIKRYYIMPNVWRTVTESQVFNWAKLFNDQNIQTDLISLTTAGREQNDEEVKNIELKINAKFYQFSLMPVFINDLVLFARLWKLYQKDKDKFEKIIFQTRMPSIGFSFYLLGLFTRSSIIFESRGATIEERGYADIPISLKAQIKARILYRSEVLLLKKSDAIIVVSDALKNYYIKKFNVDSRKFIVVPGAADSSVFTYDPQIRNKRRKELSFSSNHIVIVYSGALGMKWEIPDDVFKFFFNLSEQNSNYRFLVLTPDLETAQRYTVKYQLEEKTVIKYVSFSEVNSYLNAADIGILLRENVLMNNVASPTKFSEYLLVGLPVIISDGVFDFADIVRTTNFGVVVEDYHKVDRELNSKIQQLTLLERLEIADWGTKNLSKEQMIEKYVNALEKV